MERNFEIGDKVFDIRYGWGEVLGFETDLDWVSVEVEFKGGDGSINRISYLIDTPEDFDDNELRLLSFTEYSLNGFTKEKAIDYSKFIGKWGMFWSNKDKDERIIGKLEGYDDRYFKSTTSITLYAYFKPLTDEQIKSLGL